MLGEPASWCLGKPDSRCLGQLNRQRGPPPGPSGHLSTVHSVSTQKSHRQGCEKPELLFTPHSALEQAAWVQTSSPG